MANKITPDKTKPIPGHKFLATIPVLAYIIVTYINSDKPFISNMVLLVFSAWELLLSVVNVVYRKKHGGHMDYSDMVFMAGFGMVVVIVIVRLITMR